MEKSQKTKNMCELEKCVGKIAHRKLMFCRGLYLGTGIPFYDDYLGYKLCDECKECKRYKQYTNLFYALAISVGILVVLILGTPQGAIRRNLFFHEGVQEAFFSNVERIEKEKDTGYWHYSVVVNGKQQEWVVLPWQQVCIAMRLTE